MYIYCVCILTLGDKVKCGKCGEETDKLISSTWRRFGTNELCYPKGVCAKCDEESSKMGQAGLEALFGDSKE